jgi:hypothetical protein
MKTLTFSKQELEYLTPVTANINALDRGLQSFIITVVFKRLGLPNTTQAQYNVEKGEIYVIEPEDLKAPPTGKEETPKTPEEPKKAEAPKA